MNTRRQPVGSLLELSDSGVWAGDDPVGGVSILRSTNFGEGGEIDYSNLAIKAVPEKERVRKALRPGDILIEKSGGGPKQPVGRVAYFRGADQAHVFGNFIARLRTKPDLCDSRYLFWFLFRAHENGLTEAFQKQTTGIRNLELKRYLDVGIPLPPLEAQRRIVGLLDRAAEIRRRADAARAKARAIIPALFLDMFGDPATNPKGWPVRPLGETADFFGGATLPVGIPFTGQTGGYLLCKVSTLSLPENSNGIVSSLEWSERPAARSAVAPPGSILFPKRGAAIATNKKRLLRRPSALDPNLMGVCGKPECYDPGFLLSLFEAFDLMSIASGSTVPQLNKQDLYPLEEIVPPLSLQAAFAEQAQRLEVTARALDTAAAKAEAMAAALSAEVFGAQRLKGGDDA